MRRLLALLLVPAVLATSLTVAAPGAQAADTGNAAPQPDRIVSDEPSSAAPNILDGSVYSVAEVGDAIVVGGSFTRAQNFNTSATLTRAHLLAFDKTSGRVLTSFDPGTNGTVYKVLPGADGRSVYVAGSFTTAAGRSVPGHLFKVDVSTGVVDTSFAAPAISGQIRDLQLVGNHLFVAGKFTHINGVAQKALGTVFADSGQRDPYFDAVLAGLHRPEVPGAVTDVLQISVNAQNDSLVAVGNFTSVDGQSRSQIARFEIGNAPRGVDPGVHQTLSTWSTNLYTAGCSSRFDTYMTDVEYAPNGSAFIVSTTGAWGGSQSNNGTIGCDVVARFENNSAPASPATWTAYTGGDTTWSVEVTDRVVYAGGHQRWQNNPTAGDRAGQGAVSREGIAALDLVNGMPYSWNPTRSRGVGVRDMLATADGLYVGSDTTRFGHTPGNTYHARMAFLPLAGGALLPTMQSNSLPVDVYQVPVNGSQLSRRSFTGSSAGSPAAVPTGPGWSASTGAFMANGFLYQANSDGSLSKMTFNGSTYGAASAVNTADALVYQSDWHTDVRTITSLFYSGGFLYYTKSGTNALYRRGFEVESGIVGQQRFSTTTPAVNWSTVRGAFVAGGKLVLATTSGTLSTATWNQAAHNISGAASPVTGAGTGWASRALFPYQGVAAARNEPPVARASVSCDKLVCSFDAAGSTDPEHGPLTYDWDFGDGSPHGSGASTTHTYSQAGDRVATLVVTDDKGATGRVTATASPSDSADNVRFVGASSTNGNRTTHSVSVPSGAQVGDTLLLFFSANSASVVFTGPSGWTQVLSDSGPNATARLYTRTATAADLGGSAAVRSTDSDSSGHYVKSDTTMVAYRGTASPGVAASAITSQDVATEVHQTPTVTAPDGGSWLVSYWTDRSSATGSWNGPAGQTQRSLGTATGTSHMSSLVMDSGGRVGAGLQGGLSASADSAARGLTMSILLRSGGGGAAPANQPPVAKIGSASCSGRTCVFDGSASSDPDSDALSFRWDFGDGGSSTAVAPSHAYATDGTRTVTLTVDDGHGHVATDSVNVTPTTAPATSSVAFVGAASSNGNRTVHATPVPAGVQVGDTLLAFFTANSTNATYAAPDGWTQVEAPDGRAIFARAWTKKADAADLAAGARVTVTSSAYTKSDLTVAAYRGTDGNDPIAASASKTDNAPGATHESPAVTAIDDTSWLVSYWADKANDTTGWTAPAGQRVRQAPTTSPGTAHVTGLLTDSDGPVAAGAQGGLIATADSTSSRGASFSILLASN